MEAVARARQIKLLVLDVDGVLTNGQLLFGVDGEMVKVFHTHDGLGIAAAHGAGLKTAIITGRKSEMVSYRGKELGISHVFQGVRDKVKVIEELAAQNELSLDEVAFVGDDLNDLAVMAKVGLACAVANAVAEVKTAAHFVSCRQGGSGAVRDVIELILKAQNKWDATVATYRLSGQMNIKQ